MYNEFQKIPVPEDKLNKKIEESLTILKKKKRKRMQQYTLVTVGSLAAVFVCVIVVCLANPVMASKLPLIGNIFAQVEKDISFSGDYSKKAQKLVPEETEAAAEDTDTEKEYSATDQNISLTASEVYCDGTSVFLTLAMEKPDSLGVMWAYADQYKGWGDGSGETDIVQMLGRFSINGSEAKDYDFSLQGKQLDDTSFVGVTKINLEQELGVSDMPYELQITVDTLNWSDQSHTVKSDIGGDGLEDVCLFTGEWSLTIPVTVTGDEVQTYELGETNADGLGIQKVMVTPYEVKVSLVQPDLSSEEIQKIYDKALAQAESALGKDGADEFYADAYLENSEPLHIGAALFDQDGERIRWQEDMGVYGTYALKEKKITKVSLYIIVDDMAAIKAKDEEKAAACAVYSAEIELE